MRLVLVCLLLCRNQVLREVENHLERYKILEERQQKALALCRRNRAKYSLAAGAASCSIQDRNPTNGLSKGPCNPSTQSRSSDVVGRTCALARTGINSIDTRDTRHSYASGKFPRLGISEEESCSSRMAVENARVVMFGLGSRLGKASDREDRWL